MIISINIRPIEESFKKSQILTFEFPFELNQSYQNKPLSYSSLAPSPQFRLNTSSIQNHSIEQDFYLFKGKKIKNKVKYISIHTQLFVEEKHSDEGGSYYVPEIEYLEINYDAKEQILSLKIRKEDFSSKSISDNWFIAISFVAVLIAISVPFSRYFLFWCFSYLMKGAFLNAVSSFILLSQFFWVGVFRSFNTLTFIGLSFVWFFALLIIHSASEENIQKFKFRTPLPPVKSLRKYTRLLVPIYFIWVILLIFNFRLIFRSMIFYCVLVVIDLILMPRYASLRLKSRVGMYLAIMAPGLLHQLSIYCFYWVLLLLFYSINPLPFLLSELILFDFALLVLMAIIFRRNFRSVQRVSHNKLNKKRRVSQKNENRAFNFEKSRRNKKYVEINSQTASLKIEVELPSITPICPSNLQTLVVNTENRIDREPILFISQPKKDFSRKRLNFGLDNQRNWISSRQKLIFKRQRNHAILNYISSGRSLWKMQIFTTNLQVRFSVTENVWVSNQKREDLAAFYKWKPLNKIKLVSLRRRKVIKQFSLKKYPFGSPLESDFDLVVIKKTQKPLILRKYKHYGGNGREILGLAFRTRWI